MKLTAPRVPAPSRRRTAPQSLSDAPRLAQLCTFEACQQANPHIWPSVQSLRWFYRAHRQELIQAQAVVEVAGRSLVNSPVFVGKVLEIGSRTAAARVEAD
jgi:hypothetical protein